eukprot:gene15406-biopygen8164
MRWDCAHIDCPNDGKAIELSQGAQCYADLNRVEGMRNAAQSTRVRFLLRLRLRPLRLRLRLRFGLRLRLRLHSDSDSTPTPTLTPTPTPTIPTPTPTLTEIAFQQSVRLRLRPDSQNLQICMLVPEARETWTGAGGAERMGRKYMTTRYRTVAGAREKRTRTRTGCGPDVGRTNGIQRNGSGPGADRARVVSPQGAGAAPCAPPGPDVSMSRGGSAPPAARIPLGGCRPRGFRHFRA